LQLSFHLYKQWPSVQLKRSQEIEVPPAKAGGVRERASVVGS